MPNTLADTIQAGTPAVFDTVFYNEITKEPGDPSTVYFSWWLDGDAEPRGQYLYPTMITRYVDSNDIPHYQVIIPTLGLAPVGSNIRMIGQWDTEGGITLSDSVAVLLMAPAIPSPFS